MHATTLPSLCGLAITALTAAASSAAPDAEQAEVSAPFPAGHFQPVLTQTYRLDSSLWNGRAKALITGWIPHCVAKLSDPNLAEGGIDNLVQAGNKNAGRPFKPHVGVPWTNACVMNTVESICVALMVDPQGDAELVKAQQALRATLDQWLPVLLAAQEQDGYLQTRFTLGNPNEQPKPPPRWTLRGEHEGYVGGYFIEAGIAHFVLTYTLESADQNVDAVLRPDGALTTDWVPDMLGGVTVVRGTFADGSKLTAIPNYARLNRGGRSIVWIKDE